MARWRPGLPELEFHGAQSAGIKNEPADALPWLKNTGTDQVAIEDELPVLCTTASISQMMERRGLCICNSAPYYTTMNVLGYLHWTLVRNSRKPNRTKARPLCTMFYTNRQKIFIVCKRHIQSDSWNRRLSMSEMRFWFYCTLGLCNTINRSHVSSTRSFTSSAISSIWWHWGVGCKYELMRWKYNCPHMASDVCNAVKNCDRCILNKVFRSWRRALPLFLASGPF